MTRSWGGVRLGGPLVGLVAAVAATAAWGDLVVSPRGFVLPVLVVGGVVVLAGAALRAWGVPAVVVALGQLLTGAVGWHAAFAPDAGASALPTRGSVATLATEVELGAAALATYLSPVEVRVTGTHALLAACGLVVVWSVDVLAHGVGQPPLAGLPLLVALAVPATVLLGGLDLRVLVVAAAAYLLLLASDRHERWRGAARAEREGPGAATARTSRLEGLGGAWQVTVVAVLAALLLAPLVPVSDPLGAGGDGSGTTQGTSERRVTSVNPFVTLRRDLLQRTSTPMLRARTDAADPSYLRTTVLDVFDEDSWSTSPRDLPAANSADGTFPAPPGISAGTGGVVSQWDLELDPRYRTAWLPLPDPVREVEVEGPWRYDSRFLDVALAFGSADPQLRYSATAFRPAVTGRSLDRALSPPEEVLVPNTQVPPELPPVIEQRAREVTEGAETPYRQAVALQDWFREDGGFTYSLEQRPGSGLQLLADFVTDDRVGYCEQYAAAMAAMGRTLGIPSRVAVGFLGPEEQADGSLLFTSDARHAWTEMYFQGAGWVRFEPTPSQRTGESPDYTRESLEETETEPTPSAAPQAPEQQAPEQTPEERAAEQQDGAGAVVLRALAAAVLLAAVLVAPRVVRRRQRRRRLDDGTAPGVHAEGVWEELRASTLDAGLAWHDDRSPRAQARALVEAVPSPTRDDVEALEQLLQQVERHRYAPPGGPEPAGRAGPGALLVATPPQTDGLAVLRRWEGLVATAAATSSPRLATRLRRALLPASLLRRA